MRSQIQLVLLALLPTGACDDAPAASRPAVDQPLASYRVQLLDLAFRAASSLPRNPHIKTRTRLQEDVVLACLKLDQPGLAAGYADQIEDWRKGDAYAEIAFYNARRGASKEAQRFLDLAIQVSERPDVVGETQEWRRDRIRIGIAKTCTVLQQRQQADRFEAGAVEHERGKLDSVKVMVSSPEALDERIQHIEAELRGDLDRQRNALLAGIQVLERSTGDPSRRTRAEQLIRSTLGKVPAAVAFDVLIELAELAIRSGDHQTAKAVAEEARAIAEGKSWLPEDRIPLGARLAIVVHRAGDPAGAAHEIETAQARFGADRTNIADVFRGRPLRAIAEAWQTTGNSAAALAAYRLAVEEGVTNPNSRPRAEDLCGTCCSMATSGVEPDPALRTRMQQVLERLGDPW